MSTKRAPRRPRSAEPAAFTPGVGGADALARYWLGQTTLRLRREVGWLWRERRTDVAEAGASSPPPPPPVDHALAALDLARYDDDRHAFFAADVTARHLSERIAAAPPRASARASPRGSFGWVAHHLDLRPAECFVVALALLPSVDSAAGAVIATCQNEPSRTGPTLALAQRLWDRPDELLPCFDPAHPLWGHGLLAAAAGATAGDWQAPLQVPPLVARELLFAGGPLPASLDAVAAVAMPDGLDASATARVGAALAETSAPTRRAGLRIVPMLGAAGAPLAGVAAACTERAGVAVVQPSLALAREHLAPALTTAWLRGHAVYVAAGMLASPSSPDGSLDMPPLPP